MNKFFRDKQKDHDKAKEALEKFEKEHGELKSKVAEQQELLVDNMSAVKKAKESEISHQRFYSQFNKQITERETKIKSQAECI